MVRVAHSKQMRAEALRIAALRGVRAASDETGAAERTIRHWLRQSGVKVAKAEAPVCGAVDPTRNHRWRGEKFRLVKDHSPLRYFIVRREDVATMPKYCTVEHLFPDGRHAIHDCELVVSARSLRLHPSYLTRLANVHLCDLRSNFARGLMLEAGLLKPGDDRQLVDLILAMVERDRRRDAMRGGSNDD